MNRHQRCWVLYILIKTISKYKFCKEVNRDCKMYCKFENFGAWSSSKSGSYLAGSAASILKRRVDLCCLLSGSYETYKFVLWEKCGFLMLKLSLHIITTVPYRFDSIFIILIFTDFIVREALSTDHAFRCLFS